jgi:hypothetical protein
VADRGLFLKKKRYAVNIIDKEGNRKDRGGKTGEIKAMGLDLKRSDTPKFIQEFLLSVLVNVLAGQTKEQVTAQIKEFKHELRSMPSWEKGSPKSVNNLTTYSNKVGKAAALNSKLFKSADNGKVDMPGHVRASLNWNYLRKLNGDNYSQAIVDGTRIVVCKLKNNALGMTSVAYPTDELRLPQWFTDLPFDDAGMERTLVDDKLENMLKPLKWELARETDITSAASDLFSFG